MEKQPFHLLKEISELFNSSLEPNVFFKMVLEKCIKFTRSKKGNISFIDNKTKKIKIKYQVGLSHYHLQNIPEIKVGEGITGLAAKSKKIILVNDVDKRQDYISIDPNLKSEIVAPILFKQKVLGLISVDSNQKNNYIEEDVKFLEIVSSQIGRVLSNINYNRELKERASQNQLLIQINEILSSSLNMNETLKEVLYILEKSQKFMRGALTLFDNQTNLLTIQAQFGYNPKQVAKGIYNIDEGIVGKVFSDKNPIAIKDTSKEKKFLDKTFSRKNKKNISFFCVPLVCGAETLGVISIDQYYQDENDFESCFEFIKLLESQISKSLFIHHLVQKKEIQLVNENDTLKNLLQKKVGFGEIIGQSEVMQNVYQKMQAVIGVDSNVLLHGESGTGKELIAATIHYKSNRAQQPFVAINCATLPEHLLESELFGYKKGAFTGADKDKLGKFKLADGGTIFLDEIGELPLHLQAKILRVLEERQIDPVGSKLPENINVRLISATNRNLLAEVKKNKFREDLYYRLCTIPIDLPPLRERKADIPMLLESFLGEFKEKFNRHLLQGFSEKSRAQILAYHWPGNIRELRNIVERTVLLASKQTEWIDRVLFDTHAEENLKVKEAREETTKEEIKEKTPNRVSPISEKESLYISKQQMETAYQEKKGLRYFYELLDQKIIAFFLRKNKGIQSKTARDLQVSRETIIKKIKNLEIDIYN